MSELDITSMKVQKSTRDKLAELGKKNESFDKIILNLISAEKINRKQVIAQ